MSHFDVVSDDVRVPIKMWTRGVSVDDSAMKQLRNLANLPFIYKHIAAMPDVHYGIGSTIGSVIATEGAVIPASVGVDIGCGVVASLTSLTASDLPDSLAAMRSAIEGHIPHGRTNRGGPNDRGAWGEPPDFITEALLEGEDNSLSSRLQLITDKHRKLGRAAQRIQNHLCTLGSGNHFIEVCLDTDQRVWVMLHSGSRGIGNAIGQYFIELAKKDMKRYFINLPDQDLAYLPEGTQHHQDYIEAVLWAQDFARRNRELMMQHVLLAIRKVLGRKFDSNLVAVNCHHNYVQKETHFGKNVWLTRKGAVRAREGDLGIIPGSMGACSYIVRGLGSEQSFHSCSHGAGRVMSRNEARSRITLKEHREATAHVECRKDKEVLDESPAAYKPIDSVMNAQRDLVEVLYTLVQVLNVKG